MSSNEPVRTKLVTPRPVWFRGLYSGEFSVRGMVEEISEWHGATEYGVRLENGNWHWAGADQIKDRDNVGYRAALKEKAIALSIERANRVGASSWMDTIDQVMSDADKAEVKALWLTMPGSTCWNDAMLRWMAQT